MTFDLILLVAAFVLFVLAACGVSGGRISLVPAGLACWVATVLFGIMLVVLLPVAAFAQQAFPGQSFAFDYLKTDFTTYAVTRFELQIDAGTWTDVKIPPVVNDAQTITGANTYKLPIPALTTGSHTWSIRACNASACGAGFTALNFNMTVIASPSNGRIVSGN